MDVLEKSEISLSNFVALRAFRNVVNLCSGSFLSVSTMLPMVAGKMTRSTTWMTPLAASMSGFSMMAPFTVFT